MVPKFIFPVLLFLLSNTHAILLPRETPLYSNSSLKISNNKTTSVCCFVVQDTIVENWWQVTSYTSAFSVVNLTSITTFITAYPNVTSTNYETHVYTTNASFRFSYKIGVNPITNMVNDAPGPTQIAHILNGTATAVTTAGVVVQSPAAFYVYSSVKIITADAVTDEHGIATCGTPSAFPSIIADSGEPANENLPTFANINSNAQAYFGGPNIAGPTTLPTITHVTTETFIYTYTTDLTTSESVYTTTTVVTNTKTEYGVSYTDANGGLISDFKKPSGTVISLVTPFVYQPERGAKGETGEGRHCLQTGGTENWGYVPQTLLDFLVKNKHYSAQYPGLESCLPGGPSIIQVAECVSVLPSSQQAGGDLTSGKIVYVTPPGIKEDTPAKPTPNPPQSQVNGDKPPASKPTSPLRNGDGNPPKNAGGDYQPVPFKSPNPQPKLGPIINSIIGGGPPVPKGPQPLPEPQPHPQGAPIVIPAATTIPIADIPFYPGVSGSTRTINGAPVVVVPGPTTIPAAAAAAPPASPLANPAAEPIGSKVYVNGSPFVVIPGPTNIPLENAPAGIVGSTTFIDGVPFLVVPGPTTVAAPAVPAQGADSIGSTTMISGKPFLVIPGPTTVPLDSIPGGLDGASTTTINGTPFLLVPSQTTVPLPLSGDSNVHGQLTVIMDGTTELIIAGPTTMPINPDFSVSGRTTVIDGTTMVVVSEAMTVPAKTAAKTTSSKIASKSTTETASSTAKAPPKNNVEKLTLDGFLLWAATGSAFVLGMRLF